VEVSRSAGLHFGLLRALCGCLTVLDVVQRRPMAGKRKGRVPRIGGDFNLGGEAAEADPLLERAFVDSAGFIAVNARDNPRRFLVGRTGSGKSAVLRRLEEVHEGHVLRINPENLSLPYLTDLNVVRELTALGVHLDPLFTALWKHVLIVEIIRHRYQVNSPEKKSSVLESLKGMVQRDANKRAALEYLDEFGGSFWCETDERVREITTRFETEVGAVAEMSLGVPEVGEARVGAKKGKKASTEVRTEQADRYQRVVNKTQLGRLNTVMSILDENVLASSQNFLYLVIDDLDRDWIDEGIANDLVRCLFRAVLDFQGVRNLKIVVALRTNIFDFISFGSRAGGQEEKYRALVYRIRWTERELRHMADERSRAAAESAGLEDITTIAQLLPARNPTRGDPFDYILGRTLMRPRDVISFLNECLALASGRTRLTWNDIHAAEASYSLNRVLALRDEWKPTFPGIGDVLNIFRGSPPTMTQSELTKYLESVALLPAEPDFEGVRWLTETTEAVWSGGSAPEEWVDSWQPIVALLYDIGFLGVTDAAGVTHFGHDTPGYADAANNLGPTARFGVHPTFHPTLGVRARRGPSV
jgi:hypothetical protein